MDDCALVACCVCDCLVLCGCCVVVVGLLWVVVWLLWVVVWLLFLCVFCFLSFLFGAVGCLLRVLFNVWLL